MSACMECNAGWIKQEYKKQVLSQEVVIKCIGRNCKNTFSFQDFIKLFNNSEGFTDQIEDLNNIAAQHYIIHALDMRRCPNSNCSYSGFIQLKPCSDSLVCLSCETEWREQIHLSKSEMALMWFKSTINFKLETLTQIRNLIFEEPCPKCGVLI